MNISEAVEVEGFVDENHRLVSPETVEDVPEGRVKLIIMYNSDRDIGDGEWLSLAAKSRAFDFLNDTAEDIYSLDDGKPLEE